MDELARLIAIEEIKVLKARYFRYVDLKNWAGLRGLFCEHATIHYTDGDQGPQPLDAAMQFVQSALHDSISLHHGHMPEIEIIGPDRARAIWAMEDRVYWPENSTNPLGILKMHGVGHYHETYERHERWLIASLTLTRLRRSIELRPQRVL
jgi:hypothetical protein